MEGSKGTKTKALQRDCGPNCKSKGHARQLMSACSKGSTRQVQLYLLKCYNVSNAYDDFGRNALHMAASKGKWEILKWLLEEKSMDPEVKDVESGWTPLHRALFYGQIATARILINHGVDVYVNDKDGLGPLDILMKDRMPHFQLTETGLYEACTWGDNLNSTLGHKTGQGKRRPEVIDYFRKNDISIKKVAMSKYHTVFLASDGEVYTCGHGQGGRLGHGNQQTYVTPQKIGNIHTCEDIAVSRDHTILLLEKGLVFSCGLNNSHQLGLVPPLDHTLEPRRIDGRTWKGTKIKGICAQRFHSVVYTESAVYTFGLNAGQIGHLKVPGETTITQPRKVSAFNYKDFQVKLVAASDAVTVVVTVKGDIYILYKYQCKKIARWVGRDLEQLVVSGGHLDHSTDLETLREKGGYELIILMRTSTGKVYIWRDSEPKLKRCVWSIRRPLHVSQVSLSVQNFLFVTADGEAFKAAIPEKKPREQKTSISLKEMKMASSPPTDSFATSVTDLLEREEVTDIEVEKIRFVHRAVDVVVDKKGNNFTVLQSHPNASLTEIPTVEDSCINEEMKTLLGEANEFDPIHDVILQVGSYSVPAHKYVLAHRSEYFRKIFTEKEEDLMPGEIEKVLIENVNYELFLELLQYIYTGTCGLLTGGGKFNVFGKGRQNERNIDVPEPTYQVSDGKKQSAYSVHQEAKQRNLKGVKNIPKKSNDDRINDPLALAARFGVQDLHKRLSDLRKEQKKGSSGDTEDVSKRILPRPHWPFGVSKFRSLCDVVIQGDDCSSFHCHKCILVARSEYFKSMLGSGWLETGSTEPLTLPIAGDILDIIITYLYTDSTPEIQRCENVEFLCNVLVVADQLLINRLKHICEIRISSLVRLKNVCEVLEFASVYNANRLKKTCQQLICLNVAIFLETRSLDILSDDVMDELTTYYRNMVPAMDRRLITPYNESPSIEYLEELEAEYEGLELYQITDTQPSTNMQAKKYSKRPKRQRIRTKSSGEDSDGQEDRRRRRSSERQISVSSETEFPMELHLVEEEATETQPKETSPKLAIHIPKLNLNTVWNVGHKKDSSNASAEISSQVSDKTVSPTAVTSPSGVQTFREIMDQEMKSSAQSQSPFQRRTTIGSAKKKPKISNNEKRRLTKQQQQRPQSQDDIPSPSAESAAKPAWTGWGSPPVSSVVTSFKDLMLYDEKTGAKPKQPTTKHNPSPPVSGRGDWSTLSWGLPQHGVTPKRSLSSPKTPTSPREGENPWTRRSSQQQTVDFSSIVKDEEKQEESLVKATNKPLALIQIEEQAIQELMLQYAAASNVDESITVRRVTRAMATPVWCATSSRR